MEFFTTLEDSRLIDHIYIHDVNQGQRHVFTRVVTAFEHSKPVEVPGIYLELTQNRQLQFLGLMINGQAYFVDSDHEKKSPRYLGPLFAADSGCHYAADSSADVSSTTGRSTNSINAIGALSP